MPPTDHPAPAPAAAPAPVSPPPSAAAAVTRFMLASLAAIAVVVVGGYLVLRSITISEARRDTRERVEALGHLVESAGLDDGVLRGDADALARLDDVVIGQVLGSSIVRVKLWSRDGTVLYADEPSLIGRRYALDDDARAVLRSGGSEAELSDLARPENELERPAGKLLEAYTAIRTPDGTPLLFEIYQRFDSVSASSERLLKALAPPLVGALLVLLLFQAPLAWSMARRLRDEHAGREELLLHAVRSSELERRRIAHDLHDGIVQDLAGVAFGLAPAAAAAERRGDRAEAGALREAIDRLRQGVRDLRTLLLELHPPNLATAGLTAALDDLLSPLEAAGVATELDVDEHGAGDHDELVLRVAREALRNVHAHAAASHVSVVVRRAGGATLLTVLDDGRGIDAADRARSAERGHVGLELLDGLVARSGGELAVERRPGSGTEVRLRVPAR